MFAYPTQISEELSYLLSIAFRPLEADLPKAIQAGWAITGFGLAYFQGPLKQVSFIANQTEESFLTDNFSAPTISAFDWGTLLPIFLDLLRRWLDRRRKPAPVPATE